MLTYIVYSHTEFLDVLLTQTHYLELYDNKILLINSSDQELTELYSKYKQVIFYDDTLPYASRLLEITKLNLDYALFIHDIDILVERDDTLIEHLLDNMKQNNLDRITLQYKNIIHNPNTETIEISKDGSAFSLIKEENINQYIYNVNPSIWKISAFMDIMNKFKTLGYRTIESSPVMEYCQKYRIFCLYHDSYINCGHFGCLPFFQYIHITHGGKLLPLVNNNLNDLLADKYNLMIDKFSLNKSRQFSTKYIPEYYHGPSKRSISC